MRTDSNDIAADRPVEDEAAAALAWRRHDRTHLEVSVVYGAAPEAQPLGHVWEAYYFLPDSFRINRETFTTQHLYASFQSYVRFSAPLLSVEDFPNVAAELGEVIAHAPGPRVDWELKLFACRAREAIARDAGLLLSDVKESVEGASQAAAEFAAAVTDGLQLIRKAFAGAGTDPSVVRTIGWVDEHISRRVEMALIQLSDQLRGQDPESDVGRRVTEAAIDEARYRKERGLGPVSSVGGSTRELEDIELHQHGLKRFTSSVLWLRVLVEDAQRWALHTFHAVAAGVAMAFAVIVALTVGNPTSTDHLWIWGLAMVVAYMFKDRIKFVLQELFAREIATRLPDRRWKVQDPTTRAELAAVTEKARFISHADVPPAAAELRSLAYRDTLQELTRPEHVLRHRKVMKLHLDAMQAVDLRLTSLTEVFRLDLARWLTHTDDAKRTVTLVDPDRGELFTTKLPRSYDVVVVYRVTDSPEDDAGWQVAQVVVSRSGIQRVGPAE